MRACVSFAFILDTLPLCSVQCPPNGFAVATSNVCFACQATIIAVFALMVITCLMDTFLIFSVMISCTSKEFKIQNDQSKIAIVGYMEGRTRKVENVRETTEFLIFLDRKSPLGIDLQKAFGKNWGACCDKWNAMIQELWESDLLCLEDKNKLVVREFRSTLDNEQKKTAESIRRYSDVWPQASNTYAIRHKMPIDISGLNSTAKYRISFFIRHVNLFMHKYVPFQILI